MAEDQEGRNQAATEKRLLQAREEGQVALSREVVTASALAGATLALALAAPGAAREFGRHLQHMLANAARAPEDALHDAGLSLIAAVLPIAGAVLVTGCLAALLQTGWLIHGKALMPDIGRIDPRRGLKKIFGLDNVIEVIKSLAKVGVLAWAVWRAVADALPSAVSSLSWTADALLDRIARDLLHLFILVLACQCGIALLDVLWVRYRFAQRMRMSPEEIKRENKESDGDPRIKARLRQIRMIRARRRMMAAVSKATVVITNPTHYAVALSYERGTQAAPRIVAKGTDDVAARIREAAEKHGVPVVASPPLARALHQLPLESEVPAEHFKAVAEIIAYVWRLRGASGQQPRS
ncbi:MAG: flagellar biosynthesis protein FlhB [Acetobacteraceae bacterium]